MSPGRVESARVIVGYALAESLRKRVFTVVVALTVAFLVLYWLGARFAFESVDDLGLAGDALLDERALTGNTLFGLALFTTLFLGSVLAIFLTNGVVRGDAEAGLLQPLVVRPLGRGTMLAARYLGAVAATTVYVLAVYGIALLITRATGDWTPGHVLLPGLAIVGAVAIVAALSVLVSVFLAATAQGIAVFMMFGAGLVAGMLGQMGDALNSRGLERISEVASTALPFEALYQGALHLIATDTSGFTRAAIELGPFGGSDEVGVGTVAFAAFYVVAVIGLAIVAFSRRDL